MRDSLEDEWAAHVDAAIAREKRERELEVHKQVAMAAYASWVTMHAIEKWPLLARDAIRAADIFVGAYKGRI